MQCYYSLKVQQLNTPSESNLIASLAIVYTKVLITLAKKEKENCLGIITLLQTIFIALDQMN